MNISGAIENGIQVRRPKRTNLRNRLCCTPQCFRGSLGAVKGAACKFPLERSPVTPAVAKVHTPLLLSQLGCLPLVDRMLIIQILEIEYLQFPVITCLMFSEGHHLGPRESPLKLTCPCRM